METLLDRAKSKKTRRKTPTSISDQEIELALAWLKDEISLTQVSYALGKDKMLGGNVLYRMAICLREGYRKGKLKIK